MSGCPIDEQLRQSRALSYCVLICVHVYGPALALVTAYASAASTPRQTVAGAVMEHRWGERIIVDIPVQVSVPPLTIVTGRVLNMSISGAWINGKFDLPPLARALVIFDIGIGGRHETLPIACFVARIRADGMGVEWRELAPQIVSDLLLFATDSQQRREPKIATPEDAESRTLVAVKTHTG